MIYLNIVDFDFMNYLIKMTDEY